MRRSRWWRRFGKYVGDDNVAAKNFEFSWPLAVVGDAELNERPLAQFYGRVTRLVWGCDGIRRFAAAPEGIRLR